MECKIARFYGWSDEQISEMDFKDLLKYWRGITMIEAQDMLNQLKASDFPNMSKEERRKLNKMLVSKAYFKPEVKVLKTTDLVNYASAMNG